MNDCGYFFETTFSPNLMDSKVQLTMNLGETYLMTETGNERFGKQKLDLVIL